MGGWLKRASTYVLRSEGILCAMQRGQRPNTFMRLCAWDRGTCKTTGAGR